MIVNGGTSPFTWEITAGTLPDGITKAGNTTSYEIAHRHADHRRQAAYPITVKVTDTNGASASGNFTFVVNAAASCLINGRYALLVSGLAGDRPPPAPPWSTSTAAAA